MFRPLANGPIETLEIGFRYAPVEVTEGIEIGLGPNLTTPFFILCAAMEYHLPTIQAGAY